MDPTYTGSNRSSLNPIPDTDDSSLGNVITFSSQRAPKLHIGGRASKFSIQPSFSDKHNIGYSVFEDKGSVLMANIDAVLNFSEHIGGYIANATESDNLHFYSLLFEDHNLEMYSYLQWRRPLSISRVIISRALTKTHLKSDTVDTLPKIDIYSIVSLKPCDGYRVVGYISYGGEDPLSGALSTSLKDLVSLALVGLATIHRSEGKCFIVFPFKPDEKVSGTMTRESILDFSLLCLLLYKKVWCFRPYMCHDLLCIAFAEPREDPDKDSIDEQMLLALWEGMGLITHLTAHTSPSTVDPDIAKVQGLDMEEAKPEELKTNIKLDVPKNFSRLFEENDVAVLFPKLAAHVKEVLTTPEKNEYNRDRVEVLSRWQIPDSIETSNYPF